VNAAPRDVPPIGADAHGASGTEQVGRARPSGLQQAVDITAYIQESIRTKAFQHEQQQRPISALATIDPQMAPLNFMYCKERRAHFTAQDIPLDAVLTD
jgi:hypothetical protein